MPLFELHACVRNYHIGLTTNTSVVYVTNMQKQTLLLLAKQ